MKICSKIILELLYYCRKTGVTGKLTVNEEARTEDLFRKQSCYIMQDDNLQPLLTAYEAMMVAANLKLSSVYTAKEKKEKVRSQHFSTISVHSVQFSGERNIRIYELMGEQNSEDHVTLWGPKETTVHSFRVAQKSPILIFRRTNKVRRTKNLSSPPPS